MSFEKQRNICSVLIAETSEMVNQLKSISSQDQFESMNYKAVKKLRELQTATSDLQLFWKVFTSNVIVIIHSKYKYRSAMAHVKTEKRNARLSAQ